MDESFVGVGGVPNEPKTYKIRVSSKYLELTKKKLEVTRLPHDLTLERGNQWELGTPKSIVEPLIDYWLEDYKWREQETLFNNTLPQFRVSIAPPGPKKEKPLRIHFIHIRSFSRDAIPLLLLPAFPFTNLSFSPLFSPLHSPTDGGQAYNIVVPSIPGLGFSDPFNASPSNPLLASTAYILNKLMSILGYQQYLASATGSAASSPANIDYHLPRLLAERHSSNCLGIHIIDPSIPCPQLATAPLSYLRYSVAKFFHASIFGYTAAEWAASTRCPSSETHSLSPPSPADLEAITIHEPRDASPRIPAIDRQIASPSPFKRPTFSTTSDTSHVPKNDISGDLTLTLAYALCDSPAGLLSVVLLAIERLSPNHTLTKSELITILQLAWLPGPEGALRLWSGADAEVRREYASGSSSWSGFPVSITAYSGALGDSASFRSPVWAETRHRIVHLARRDGLPGLPWENAEPIVEGVRALSRAVWKMDNDVSRLEAGTQGIGSGQRQGNISRGEGALAGEYPERPTMVERDIGSSETVVPSIQRVAGMQDGAMEGKLQPESNERLENDEKGGLNEEISVSWIGEEKGKQKEEQAENNETKPEKKKWKGRRLQRRMGVEGWGYIWEE